MLPAKLILSPTDFSDSSHEALNAAADLARLFGSELLLVHVVPALPKLPSNVSIFREEDYELALRKDAEEQLQALAGKFVETGLQARTKVGVANDIGMELLRTAEETGVDLIVISTHGMTGWRRLAFGSVAEKVVRMATCPVLVMRAQAAGESAVAAAKPAAVSAAR